MRKPLKYEANDSSRQHLPAGLMDKNFGLDPQKFEDLVKAMRKGDNTLLHLIYDVHFNLCLQYLKKRFELDESQAYDATMDALVRFRAKVLQGKVMYGNLKYLFTRIAVNGYVDQTRDAKKLANALEAFTNLVDHHDSGMSDEEILTTVSHCMDTLAEKDAILLRRLFLDETDPVLLAKDLGVSYPALRKRKERALDRLKSNVIEYLNLKASHGEE